MKQSFRPVQLLLGRHYAVQYIRTVGWTFDESEPLDQKHMYISTSCLPNPKLLSLGPDCDTRRPSPSADIGAPPSPSRCLPQRRPSLSPTAAVPLALPHTRRGSGTRAFLLQPLPHDQGMVPLTHGDGGGQVEERVNRIRRTRPLQHDAVQVLLSLPPSSPCSEVASKP